MLTSLEPDFHDGIIQNISVDFELKQTKLSVKQWSGHDNSNFILSELVFNNVAWQDFKDFNSFNCIWGIEVSGSFSDFENYHQEYLIKMKNYFPSGILEKIKNDPTLNYYYITSSIGLDGFVICKELTFTQTEIVGK